MPNNRGKLVIFERKINAFDFAEIVPDEPH